MSAAEHASWMERAPHKRLMLFSGRSNPALGEAIAERIGIELGEVLLKTFTNGEVYVRYEESIRGADMFIVQSCSSPTNDSLMELLIMAQAARLASAKRITAVMPWYPYGRQDKKSMPREPITAKLVADMLAAAGVDRVLTMDLHAGQLQGFFDGAGRPHDRRPDAGRSTSTTCSTSAPRTSSSSRRRRPGEARQEVLRDARRRASP